MSDKIVPMVKCRSCDGTGVVWHEFTMMMSTAPMPAGYEIKRPDPVANKCPVCEGRMSMPAGYYERYEY